MAKKIIYLLLILFASSLLFINYMSNNKVNVKNNNVKVIEKEEKIVLKDYNTDNDKNDQKKEISVENKENAKKYYESAKIVPVKEKSNIVDNSSKDITDKHNESGSEKIDIPPIDKGQSILGESEKTPVSNTEENKENSECNTAECFSKNVPKVKEQISNICVGTICYQRNITNKEGDLVLNK